MKQRRTPLTQQEKAQIENLYLNDQQTITAIADQMSLNFQRVYRYLKINNLARPSGRRGSSLVPVSTPIPENIFALHRGLIYRYVSRQANRYHLPHHLDDMMQEAAIGLITAYRKFDASKGYAFPTYFLWWVKAYVDRYVKSQLSIVQYPDRTRSISKDVPLDEPVFDDSIETKKDLIPDDSLSVEGIMQKAETREMIRRVLGKACLNEKDTLLAEHRFLNDPPTTIEEVARIMNVTKQAVHWREQQIKNRFAKAVGLPAYIPWRKSPKGKVVSGTNNYRED